MGQLGTQSGQPLAGPRPWRRLIVAGAVLVAAAIVIGVASVMFFAFSIWRFVGDEMIAREVVPATFAVRIDEPGTYQIFYEHRSVVAGRSFRTSREMPALDFRLADATGRVISLEPSRIQHTYERPSREGRSWFEFEALAVGTYELDVTGTDGQQYVIAVGQPSTGVFLAGMASFVCGGGMAMLMLVTGSVLLVVGFVQRSRAYLKAWAPPTHP